MLRLATCLCLGLIAARAGADGCPVAPDHEGELDGHFHALQAAPNELAGREISNRMWALWTDAPDEPSQAMLDQGMSARNVGDLRRALDRFNRLVDYCPHYAEGYNQRAFVNFLRGDYAAALPDLDRALEINPRHVGALSGKALTLLGLDRDVEGQEVLRAALDLNPWLGERALLTPRPGEDL